MRPSHSGNGHLTYHIAGEDHHMWFARVRQWEEIQHALLKIFIANWKSTSGYCVLIVM